MADDPLDPNPALRAELEAALTVLAPQIRGLHDFATPISITPELLAKFTEQITLRERRRDLIQSTIDELDAVIAARRSLMADGYPDLPGVELDQTLFDDLSGQNSDLDAAADIFGQATMVSSLGVQLSPPRPKS